jgi:lipopolysaccharide biosynthesis glycosyltransferase
MQSFCTIITADHFAKAAVLCHSIQSYDKDAQLYVLVADENKFTYDTESTNLKPVPIKLLSGYLMVSELYKKYAHINFDNFRWSLKPVFASYLLRSGLDKVIYLDCDMFFVNDFNFLFADLEQYDILLTPHWNSTVPSANKNGFLSNFSSGLFSAGFFGANKKGLPALDWWANACHFMMGEHIKIGVHDDQRYLDIFPVLFENMKIIRHRGCNIGSWNFEESKRSLVNGEIRINKEFPVIFIHFDQMLVSTILKGHDPLLKPYLDQYSHTYELLGYHLSGFITVEYYAKPGLLQKIKWTLMLRTRLKRFFYKLAESL